MACPPSQVNSRHPERRALVAETCGSLLPLLHGRSNCQSRGLLLASLLRLTGDDEADVRHVAAVKLAQVLPHLGGLQSYQEVRSHIGGHGSHQGSSAIPGGTGHIQGYGSYSGARFEQGAGSHHEAGVSEGDIAGDVETLIIWTPKMRIL